MTIKQWIETYARELSGSEPEKELEAIVEQQKYLPTHIMGRPIDEVCQILSALELERIEDLKMTMDNLGEWMERVRDDYRKAMQKAMDNTIEAYKKGYIQKGIDEINQNGLDT